MDSLPNFLIHGARLRALRARELCYQVDEWFETRRRSIFQLSAIRETLFEGGVTGSARRLIGHEAPYLKATF